MKISEYRQQIDAIDKELLQLLNKRASLALKIGDEKFKNRISVQSQEREKLIFEKLYSENPGPLQKQHIHDIFLAIITACRNLQHLYQSFEDV